MPETQLANKAIKQGHLIANKIKNARSISDVNSLQEEIEKYCDFLDDNFGRSSDIDDGKECSLTMSLYVAVDWKKKSLRRESKDNSDTDRLSEYYLRAFLEELEERNWALDNR